MIARIAAACSNSRRLAVATTFFVLASMTFAAPGKMPVDLNFVNTEISTVVSSLANISGVNIVVAPEVKGIISIKVKGVTVEEALKIITNMSGCSYRYANGVYMVSKGEIAKGGSPLDDYVVYKLQVAAAADVLGALSVAYPDIQARSLPNNNRIILSGDQKRIDEAIDFIEQIDVPTTVGAASRAVEVIESTYQVKSIVPWQAKQYLEELYRDQGLRISYAPIIKWKSGEAAADAPVAKSGDAAAQGWTSEQLILRGPKSVVNDALASVKKIDLEVPTAQKRCSAKRIFPTHAIAYLLGLYEARGLSVYTAPMTFTYAGDKSLEKSGVIGARVVRDKDGKLNIAEPVGDFILIGPESIVAEAEQALAKIDVGPERVEKVVSVRFLHVNEAQKRLTELYGDQGLQVSVAPRKRGDTPKLASNEGTDVGGAKSGGEDDVTRVFDIVLRGPADVVARAVQMLNELDTVTTQIAIKSEIINVDSNEVKTLGVEWPAYITTNVEEIQPGNPLKIGRLIRDPISFNLQLNALQTKRKAKLISQPSTVVQNGREALIHVGDKVLYETVASYDNGRPIFSTVELNVGVTLKVLPQMSHDGIITLEITSNVSDLVGFNQGASGAQLPQLRETASSTVVQVRDGETLVIGGLTQNGTITEKRQVPLLGDLPLIGGAFKSTTTKPENTELIIMVTPHALTPELLGVTTPVAATTTTTTEASK